MRWHRSTNSISASHIKHLLRIGKVAKKFQMKNMIASVAWCDLKCTFQSRLGELKQDFLQLSNKKKWKA